MSSEIVQWPSQPQVFINFRGEDLRLNFISHLARALRRENIKVFIDSDETKGEDLAILFTRIKESRIAIAVISSKYTESSWCLNELVQIKECVEENTMKVYPVFYKLDVKTVREQRKEFGDNLKDLTRGNPKESEAWKEALQFVTKKIGERVDEKRYTLK